MSNRAYCLAIGVTTVLIALALTWPVWAETNQLTFCDREDEITAVTIYGDDAIPIINAKFPNDCGTFTVDFVRGQSVETVKAFGKLWAITPVLIYAVGRGSNPIEPTEQWASFFSPLVEATWKPEFGQSPEDYIRWFEYAQTTDAAYARFGWRSCCSHADRFVTQFRPSADGEKWYYQKPDKSWAEIPDDIIHWEDDPTMPEQLKREGVLFIYQSTGALTCFWPPQTTF